MTEEEWQTETRPTGMLFIREKPSERKVLLFNCACCRRIWNRLGLEDKGTAKQAEASVDDPAAIRELRLRLAFEAARLAAGVERGATTPAVELEETRQAELVREIFGNPFRPVNIASTWQTPTVSALAQGAYDNRILPAGLLEPDRLAVLADALEDAGCTDTAILEHLRGPGSHVRGCWPVDLLLGRT